MDLLESVLLEVKGGKTSFEPRDNSEAAIEDFQQVASALVHAKNRHLIGGGLPRMDNYAGVRRYCFFIVSQGLTYEGEQYLKEKERDAAYAPESLDPAAQKSLIDNLREIVRGGDDLVQKSNYGAGVVAIWSRQLRQEIGRVFGSNSEVANDLLREDLLSYDEARRFLQTYLPRVKRFLAAL